MNLVSAETPGFDESYFPTMPRWIAGSVLEGAIPKETGSVLRQPLCTVNPWVREKTMLIMGLVFVASSISYAYDEKDASWIKAIANKLKDNNCYQGPQEANSVYKGQVAYIQTSPKWVSRDDIGVMKGCKDNCHPKVGTPHQPLPSLLPFRFPQLHHS